MVRLLCHRHFGHGRRRLTPGIDAGWGKPRNAWPICLCGTELKWELASDG